jgi:hypothetical protein
MMRFIFGVVVRVWLWVVSWFKRAPEPLRTVYLEELPEQLIDDAVYVLGVGPHKWFVALLCPCGCGATLQMSLLADANPRWRLIEHSDRTISLAPSVWRRIGCRSHFFLRHGFIRWCWRDVDGAFVSGGRISNPTS